MLATKTNNFSFFCTDVKYSYSTDAFLDYSAEPRPCNNIMFMLNGQGIIKSNGQTFCIKKGDIFYIPQNSTYSARWVACPKCEFHTLHFRLPVEKNPFVNKLIPVQHLNNECFELLYEHVLRINSFKSTQSTDYYLFLASFYHLVGSLLNDLKFDEQKNHDSCVTPAIKYLENNFEKTCTVEFLASLCYLSPSRFHFVFKKQTGLSPIVYKNKIAISHSAQALLLNKDKSIESIAREYGFESPIYFRRLFKKIFGKTPKQYQKEQTLL